MSETTITLFVPPTEEPPSQPSPEVRLTAEDIEEIRANYRLVGFRTRHWQPYFMRVIFDNTESFMCHEDLDGTRFRIHVTEYEVDHEVDWPFKRTKLRVGWNPTREDQLIRRMLQMAGNETPYDDGVDAPSQDRVDVAAEYIFGSMVGSEDDPKKNYGFGIKYRVSGEAVDSSNWDRMAGAIKILLDPYGTRTQDEMAHAIRQLYLDYILSDAWDEPVESIASRTGEKTNTVEKRILRARKEVDLMIGKICPEGTCPSNACMHVAAVDREFYHYVFKMKPADSTKIIREGGYYAFVKLDRYRLTRLNATTNEEAEAALDRLRQQSVDNAVERFPAKDRDRARVALTSWTNKEELPPGIPQDLLAKFTEISDAFDSPGVIRHIDPDPTYMP